MNKMRVWLKNPGVGNSDKAEAIRRLGVPEFRDHAPLVHEILRGPSHWMLQQAAASALAKMDPANARKSLPELFFAAKPGVRKVIIRALVEADGELEIAGLLFEKVAPENMEKCYQPLTARRDAEVARKAAKRPSTYVQMMDFDTGKAMADALFEKAVRIGARCGQGMMSAAEASEKSSLIMNVLQLLALEAGISSVRGIALGHINGGCGKEAGSRKKGADLEGVERKIIGWMKDPERSYAAFVAEAIMYLDPSKGASGDSVLKAHEELGKILLDPVRLKYAFMVYREIYEPLGRILEGEMLKAGAAIVPAIKAELANSDGSDRRMLADYALHLEGVLAKIEAKNL